MRAWWNWVISDTERFKAVISAASTVVAALIAAVIGTILARRYTARRDLQDRESQWRSHAVELTKLDLQRKLAAKSDDGTPSIRPSILDFLANYRDLQELGQTSPKELYLKIEQRRIDRKREQRPPAVAVDPNDSDG